MTARIAILGLLAVTAAACGGSSLDPAGTAGSSGTGGTAAASAGTTGTAGTTAGGTGGGGSGGTSVGGTGGDGTGGSGLPICGITIPPEAAVEVQLDGSDAKPVAAPVTASVTVASVESCATVACPLEVVTGMQKIVLTTVGSQSWALYLRNTAMPTDRIKVGDTFDMTVDAGINQGRNGATMNQTVVLAHGSDLVVFAANLGKSGAPTLLLPMLSAFGIDVSDLGPRCETPGECITERPHNVRVKVGTESASVIGGQTVQVGWLSFTNGAFYEWIGQGACDGSSRTRVAGFRGVPPPTCGAQVPSGMEFAFVGSNGIAVATDVSATVTIASIDSCATVSCAWAYPDGNLQQSGSSTSATRFVVASGSNQQWTLYLRLPDMPSGLVAPGDAFDLVVRAGMTGGPYQSVYQTAVLARGGRLTMFGSNLMGLSSEPPLPQLDSYGIALGDGGVVCQSTGFSCGARAHAVRATVGTQTAAAVPGQTIRVGDLSFTNDLAVDYLFPYLGCHTKAASVLGGFMRPATLQSRR